VFFIKKIILLSTFLHFSAQSEIIKHLDNSNEFDQQKSYFVELLKLSLEKSSAKYGPFKRETSDITMVSDRQLKSVDQGILDVVWAMTSKNRENLAMPIRIPLLKGALGYRVLVIRKNQKQQFSDISNTKALQKLVAVQGADWPDFKILKSNNYAVQGSSWYSSIYKSLQAGFYDYYPRSIVEAWSEMNFYDSNNLLIDNNHLIQYPTAIYFFVNNKNHRLAARLNYGLMQAIDDGSFDKLFTEFPSHTKGLQELKSGKRMIHKLNNPYLPEKTPITDTRLWLNPVSIN
jgi:hypothetical protein